MKAITDLRLKKASIFRKYTISPKSKENFNNVVINRITYDLKKNDIIYPLPDQDFKEEYYNPEKYKTLFFLVDTIGKEEKELYPFLHKDRFELEPGTRYEVVKEKVIEVATGNELEVEYLNYYRLCLRQKTRNVFHFFEEERKIGIITDDNISINPEIKKLRKKDLLIVLNDSSKVSKEYIEDIKDLDFEYITLNMLERVNKKERA